MSEVQKMVIATNDNQYFNNEVSRMAGYGYSVVPGTLHVSSHERGPNSTDERVHQIQGNRFYREQFFVEMKKTEKPKEQKDTD